MELNKDEEFRIKMPTEDTLFKSTLIGKLLVMVGFQQKRTCLAIVENNWLN